MIKFKPEDRREIKTYFSVNGKWKIEDNQVMEMFYLSGAHGLHKSSSAKSVREAALSLAAMHQEEINNSTNTVAELIEDFDITPDEIAEKIREHELRCGPRGMPGVMGITNGEAVDLSQKKYNGNIWPTTGVQ